MGELGALFNPGMRHEQEERRSKALQREEEGDSREVDPRIDLESGVAVIATGDQEAAAESHPSNGSAADGGRSHSVSSPSADQAGSEAPSTLPVTDPSDPDGAAAPARPRPRGKRGMAARSR